MTLARDANIARTPIATSGKLAMNRLSLAPVTINDAAPPALIAAASLAGFQSIDLRLIAAPGAPPIPPVVGSPAMLAEIATLLRDTGITVFSATGIFLSPDWRIETVLPALETVARFGGEQFLAVGNDPESGRTIDNLGLLCDAAAGFKLKIALEFMPYMPLASLGQAVEVVKAAARPNLGLVIDALHLARSGGTPGDVAQVSRELIGYLQLCDAPSAPPPAAELRLESLTDRLHPGDGELWLGELLDALPEDVTIDLESPVLRLRQLSPSARVALAGAALRRFLADWRRDREGRA